MLQLDDSDDYDNTNPFFRPFSEVRKEWIQVSGVLLTYLPTFLFYNEV
jgi:hypothetical protein